MLETQSPDFLVCLFVCFNISSQVVMGGGFQVAGNVSPRAEYNWWFDAASAQFVLDSLNGRLVIIPLDATTQVITMP
jgi:purine nucleosidase